ncbi:MAG TPA: methylated-DNA--[protein]-cysteine S-methyltransferase [Terriglobales bacterium]|nr:methylated-DNA--[protein]-cysteine S-methyltransferase [Terriglobales bacterium]
MSTTWYSSYQSPFGQLLLASTERGLCALEFDFDSARLAALENRDAWQRSDRRLDRWKRELDAYFSRKLRVFREPLDLLGSEFQLRCWNALLAIPYGETRSYADQARAVGSPRGFRAVGMANHDNPIAIIVPCHRVITSDHKLGGYGGGLSVKEWLLDMEGAVWRRQKSIEFAHAG